MTDDEILDITREMFKDPRWPSTAIYVARAIIAAYEAKLREGTEVPEAHHSALAFVAHKSNRSPVDSFYTLDQLQTYGDARALAARDAVIEECAVECEGMYNYAGEEVAMCIRALKRGEA